MLFLLKNNWYNFAKNQTKKFTVSRKMTGQDHYTIAEQKLEAEDFQGAIISFSKALTENYMISSVLFKRGWANMKISKYKEAIEDFDKAIELEPGNASFYSERGVTMHLSGKNTLAIIDMNRAVELEPGYGYRYASRAYIRDNMGDTEGAIQDYNKAIALDPEDSISLNNLGMLQEKLGYLTKAKSNYKKADELADKGKIYPLKQEVNKPVAPEPKDPTASGVNEYLKIIASVFRRKSVLKEFIDFLKKKLGF